MLSISNDEAVDIGDRILAAAASCVRDFGVERVTLAEIARRAGVSRPTVYRRWPDTRSILAGAADRPDHRRLAVRPGRSAGPGRPGRADRRGRRSAAHATSLIASVLRSAPDLAMVYISGRLGTSQQILIDLVADELRTAQADGSVRAGDARQMSAMVLLIAQSTIQSGPIVESILDADALAGELSHALNGYLAP